VVYKVQGKEGPEAVGMAVPETRPLGPELGSIASIYGEENRKKTE
jgi:hypothetical protein